MLFLEDFLGTFARAFSFLIALACMVSPLCHAREKQQRISLSTFRTLKGEVELESVSRAHLDIGVEEVSDSQGRRCQILTPKATKKSEDKWAPLDFYTQMRPADAIKYAADIGKPDFFFKGDDFNRNGRGKGDSHKHTRELAPSLRDTLDFKNKKPQEDKVDIVVTFQRGQKLKFEGLMQARTFEVADGCDAALLYCTKTSLVEGRTVCDPDGWTDRIIGIDAIVDTVGYSSDLFSISTLKEIDRNDVYSLVALTIGPDDDIEDMIPGEIVLTTKAAVKPAPKKARKKPEPEAESDSKAE